MGLNFSGNSGIGGVVGNSGISGSTRLNGTLMVYCEQDSSDSYYRALTIGKQYRVTRLYSTSGTSMSNGMDNYYLQDDNGKGIYLSPINFCTIDQWRNKQLDSILDEK